MTEKHLTVILYGSDRNLWNGAPVQVRVTDVFAQGGPKPLHQGRVAGATVDLRLDLPFDAGQIYGVDFSAPGHRPAWQLVRRSDFLRMPEEIEGPDAILRLMLVPDKPGIRDLSQGFQRLAQRGSPVAAAGAGLDEDDYQELEPANRMALLNIEAKLRETFVDSAPVLSFVKAVRHVAVDRSWDDESPRAAKPRVPKSAKRRPYERWSRASARASATPTSSAHGHGGPHPRVDAAHVLTRTLRLHLRRPSVAGVDELELGNVQAFGRGLEITRQLVQLRDEPASELIHLGERVDLAATVVGLDRLTLFQPHRARREVPGAD